MVKGDIVCSGSPGMLREEYGRGYRVNLKMANTASVEDVHIYMSTNFTSSKFVESKHSWMKYTVQEKISSLLSLLATAKSSNIIDSFTIDVTSLEDIFLQIANAATGSINQLMEPGSHFATKPVPRAEEAQAWKVEGATVSDGDSEIPVAADYVPPPFE